MKLLNTARYLAIATILAAAAASSGCGHSAFYVARLPVPNPTTVSADADVRQVALANTKCGFRLLEQLTKANPGKNVFFSPFSISNALAMLLNGAGGTTRTEMASTLSLQSLSMDQVNRANALLLPSLENPGPKVEVDVANALWADKTVKLAQPFVTACANFYQAPAASLDFGNPSAAANTINRWASDNTKGQINDFVTPDDLDQARVVLSNAVYFHGKWQYPFDPSKTYDGPFTLEGGAVKTFPMMARTEIVPYLETDQFQLVSVPYQGDNRMSMYLMVPKSNLGDILGIVNATSWESWIKQMKPTFIGLMLPRFQVDYSAEINDPLKALGMNSAFTPDADFGPMGQPDVMISKVLHKALIQVNEEGTVAIAFTFMEAREKGRDWSSTEVLVNRPFLCAIRDNLTGTLLFAGAIYEPETLNR